MSDRSAAGEYPLLEIEIIQLSNLFGGEFPQQSVSMGANILAVEYGEQEIADLNELDIYAFSIEQRREIFFNAAFQAIMGRRPTSEESYNFKNSTSSDESFESIINDLRKSRDSHIFQYNECMDQMIAQTIDCIDRWNGKKLPRWWR